MEAAELEARGTRLLKSLEAEEAAAMQLEVALEAASQSAESRGRELCSERGEEQRLSVALADGEQREEQLRRELAQERHRAQEASRVAAELLERRRNVSFEADEALRRCNGALASACASARAVRISEEQQVATAERTCRLARELLGPRLDAVHGRVAEAEGAHARSVLELQEELREQRRHQTELEWEKALRRHD
mmetsp:Transcript_26390/g.61556  ORF Transcript_26390/g.61556 Transcript_26390/m.61556 type:complete len:194 (+) Transcript_26390:1111-1692(+)